ncbi:hypothetical protein S83_036694, partial [Arachis hypogaea]
MWTSERRIIHLEQGWDFIQQGITKLKIILEEGLPEPYFSSDDYLMLYTTIYNMCTQRPPHDYSQQLYDKYKEVFEEYIQSTVLPSLREKHDEFMLIELVKRWANHKIMVRWLSRFFHFLDRHFIAWRSLPRLSEVGLTCFCDLVYKELNVKVRDAVIFLIDQEREGMHIDRALLKNVLDIFVGIGMGRMDHYENDFETAMLKDSSAYYSQKASNWILEDSCSDYMLKAEECLKWEKDRVAHYLHSSGEPKLLEKVQHELLFVYANQLLQKEHSGCHALLRDDKHVISEGMVLVKQAEDAASTKRAEETEAGLVVQDFDPGKLMLHLLSFLCSCIFICKVVSEILALLRRLFLCRIMATNLTKSKALFSITLLQELFSSSSATTPLFHLHPQNLTFFFFGQKHAATQPPPLPMTTTLSLSPTSPPSAASPMKTLSEQTSARFCPSDLKAIAYLSGCPSSIADVRVPQNVKLLLDEGLTKANIHHLLRTRPSVLSSADLKKTVEEVKQLGFDPSQCNFSVVLLAKKAVTKSQWDAKVDVLKKWGWSEQDFSEAFRRHPHFMLRSKDKLNAVMSFWISNLGWDSSAFRIRPCLFGYSLEKRLIPRAKVVKYLLSNGLMKKNASIITPFSLTEELFLKKCITCFEEKDRSRLLTLYQGGCFVSNPQLAIFIFMSTSERKIIDLEQAWDFMQKGITKLKNILEGLPEPHFSSEDYMMLYTTIYTMCTQKPPHDYSQQLYDKYKELFEEYIQSTGLMENLYHVDIGLMVVLRVSGLVIVIDSRKQTWVINALATAATIQITYYSQIVEELVKRWANHKIMVGWLCRFFRYLETSIAARRSLPPLNEVGLTCFYDRVYKELNGKVRDAVISIVVPKGSVTELVIFWFCLLLVEFILPIACFPYPVKCKSLQAEETEAGLVVQDFVRKVIELHDKYLSY